MLTKKIASSTINQGPIILNKMIKKDQSIRNSKLNHF
jgi:hypothetical protein